MIVSVGTLVGNDEYEKTEVTLRCRIVGPPQKDKEKILYRIDDSQVEQSESCFLSFWHDSPPEWASFSQTRDEVLDLVEAAPLQKDEEVLVRGVPQRGSRGWYLNVTSLFIRQPDLLIGKGEMRSSTECPRIYDLRFNKNVYSPGRYDFSKGALKGTIAHHTLEYAIENEAYRTLFEDGWTESQVELCLDEVLDERHQFTLALCRLAWVSVNEIKEWAIDSVTNLLLSDDFCNRIASSNRIVTERKLAESIGFRGRTDIVVDGVPYDLKTNRFMNEKKWRQHRFQLQVYLVSLLVESLEPGESIEESLANLQSGVLVYPNVKDEEDVVFTEVELDYDAIANVMRLRNQAAQLREGFGVPTTYGRDCEGCSFSEPDQIQGGGDYTLSPACTHHCQSERRWPCQHTVDGEVMTECPLYHDCDQRLEFRDPVVTDHYSQIRDALQEERSVRRDVGLFVDALPDTILERAGLVIPDLHIESLQNRQQVVYSMGSPAEPSFTPGDTVNIVANNGVTTTATYYGRRGNDVVFDFEATPPGVFLDPGQTYQVVHEISAGEYPRDLLSFVDFAQRSGIDPRLTDVTNESPEVTELSPESVDEAIEALQGNDELYVDLPNRQNRTETLAEIAVSLSSAELTMENGEHIPESDQRTLILAPSPRVLDAVEFGIPDELSTLTLDASTPNRYQEQGGSHALYKALEESDVILSTVGFALSNQVFHSMREGDKNTRTHSDRFFDMLVLTDAQKLTEPEFFFLQDLADRIVSVGDVSRSGPELVSEAAKDANLEESYFQRAYRQYTTLSASNVECFYVSGHANEKVEGLLTGVDAHLEAVDGDVEFVAANGQESLPDDQFVLNQHVQADGQSYDIGLEVVEATDILEAAAELDALASLNIEDLRIDDVYTISDYRFRVKNKDIAPDREGTHLLTVTADMTETPFLTRHLLMNEREAEVVVDVCKKDTPDAVLTPFASHAAAIRSKLEEANLDIPVRTLEDFHGDTYNHTVISFAVANKEHRMKPPVNMGETLYTLLTSAQNLTIVGDPDTLTRNRLTAQLIE